MASLVYNGCIYYVSLGDIDWDNHTFKMMLVNATYVPSKTLHTARSQVTNEVSGTGYTSGGVAITPTVTKDDTNNRTDITFAPITFPVVTLSSIRAGVIYRNSGTSSTDWLVAYVDFVSTYSPSAQNFVVTTTTPLRFQNTT